MTMTPEQFWAQPSAPAPTGPDAEVPRDQWNRPLILLPDGRRKAYHRASSFGKQIEWTKGLDDWKNRQVARGMAIRILQSHGQLPLPTLDEPVTRAEKGAWNAQVEDAQEAAGSNVKSALGTAIHGATELIDRGEPINHLLPLLQERAIAYWRFCKAEGIRPTSIEVFGVEDVHRVAGTWDRTGWWRRKHKIVDVKTSGSMDFAGIGFAVQLAEYSRMSAYDLATGERTPHEHMDLEEGLIIHVSREEGGPVELYTVDLTVGWEYAVLVDQVKKAQKEGKHAIRPAGAMDARSAAIVACTSVDQLRALWRSQTGWGPSHRELARMAAVDLTHLSGSN